MLQIYTFGELRIECNGHSLQPSNKNIRDLLAYLILYRDRPISRDALANIFWPEQDEAFAQRTLSRALWQLRSTLGPAANYLATTRDTISLILHSNDWIDVAAFERAYSSFANQSLDHLFSLSQAVALYKADFLKGCYGGWVLLERERLHKMYLEMLKWLITLHKQRGEYTEALIRAQQLAEVDPLCESNHQELMRIYYLLGREQAALEQYETLRHILETELKVEPSTTTMALANEIADHMGEPQTPYLPSKTKIAPVFDEPKHIPLVGRDEERAKLLAHLEATINGQGRLVLIEGESGVGKTRLAKELAQNAQWRGMQVCWGSGQELDPHPPYALIQEALRQALSHLRANQLKTLVRGSSLWEVSLLLPELAKWLPDLHPNTTPEPKQQRTHLLDGLNQTIISLGQIIPHILIFDNLQWADTSSLSTLIHLSGKLAESRVLVIGCYQRDEVCQQSVIGEMLQALDQASGHKRILLKRLNSEQIRKLVRCGLGTTTGFPTFEQYLYQEMEGNPLFTLEMLRMLRDDGQLRQDVSGIWKVPWREDTPDTQAQNQAKNLESFQSFTWENGNLSTKIYQVINRRLVNLNADEMTIIKTAAILGNDFDFELLVQASQLENQTARPIIKKLLWQRFLVEGSHSYCFEHDKIRQAVYTGIAEAERQKLHARAGQVLETQFPNRVAQLAHHFYLGQSWEKAADYNHQAGQLAHEVYAYDDAIICYTRALKACQHLATPNKVQKLYQERGEDYRTIGQFDQAEADFRSAYKFAQKANDVASQTRAINSLSKLQVFRGNFHTALKIAQESFNLASKANLPIEMAMALDNQANASYRLGNYQKAIESSKHAAILYERLGNFLQLADSLCRLGVIFLRNSNLTKAQIFLERALMTQRQLNKKIGLSTILNNLSALWYYRGNFSRSQEIAREALGIASSIDDLYGEAYASDILGCALREQGFINQAIPLLQRSIDISRQIGEQPAKSSFLAELAKAYQLRGDLKQAEEILEQALTLSKSSAFAGNAPQLQTYQASLFLETNHCKKALEHACIGLQMAEEEKEFLIVGTLHRLIAQATIQLGQKRTTGEITHHFEESIRILKHIGAEAELARSQMLYGLYLKRSANAKQINHSTRMLDEAKTSFQRLGMANELAQFKTEENACLLHQINVRLPRSGASNGRSLLDDEYVNVTWTLSMPGDNKIPGKAARRRHRLQRLLKEAADQSAVPMMLDLAAALDVHARTLQRDLAILQATNQYVIHRGNITYQNN